MGTGEPVLDQSSLMLMSSSDGSLNSCFKVMLCFTEMGLLVVMSNDSICVVQFLLISKYFNHILHFLSLSLCLYLCLPLPLPPYLHSSQNGFTEAFCS